jgi:hypothetical protein
MDDAPSSINCLLTQNVRIKICSITTLTSGVTQFSVVVSCRGFTTPEHGSNDTDNLPEHYRRHSPEDLDLILNFGIGDE